MFNTEKGGQIIKFVKQVLSPYNLKLGKHFTHLFVVASLATQFGVVTSLHLEFALSQY